MEGIVKRSTSPGVPDTLDLNATNWIDGYRPEGQFTTDGYKDSLWETVDLKGNISSSKRQISGDVTSKIMNSGCSTFTVKKSEG